MKTQGPVIAYLPDRGIGDLMWHLPTIRAIAAKTASGKVVLAARPSTRAAEVLAVEPTIERIEYLTYHSGPWKTVREIADFHRLCRRLRPSAVWILEKIGRPAQAAWLAGVPERRGFGLGHASQERWLSAGPKLPKAMRKAHRIEKLAAFEALNGLAVASREPALQTDAKASEAIRVRFGHLPRPWTVFGAGAVDEHRCWPIEAFIRLADTLASEGGTTFWLGGPQDSAKFAAAIDGLQDPGRSALACDLPLSESAALLEQADVFVGNDSGPLNLACAVGTRAVGLYGDTPVLHYSQWLAAAVSPTLRLPDLTPEQVLETVRRFAGPVRTSPTNAAS